MLNVLSLTLPATQGNPFQYGGKSLVIMTAAANVDVQVFSNGRKVADLVNIPAGPKVKVPVGYDSFAIQFHAGGSGSITVGIGDEESDVDFVSITGTLNTILLGGSGLQESSDVTSAGAPGVTALIAANAARRSLIITSLNGNNAAGVRIGNSPGAAKGSVLYPGQSITLDTQAAVSVYDANNGDVFTIQEVLA